MAKLVKLEDKVVTAMGRFLDRADVFRDAVEGGASANKLAKLLDKQAAAAEKLREAVTLLAYLQDETLNEVAAAEADEEAENEDEDEGDEGR